MIRSAVQPYDETTALFVELMTVPAPEINAVADRFVNEMVREPTQVRAKILEVQLSVRELDKYGLYDAAHADRLSIFQDRLNKRLADIRSNPGFCLRCTIVIVAGAVLLSYGFPIIRRVGRRMELEVGMWGSGRSLGRRLLVNSPSRSLAADLRILRVPKEAIRQLDLNSIRAGSFPMQEFYPTNIPGLSYSVVDEFENVELGLERKIIFKMSPPEGSRYFETGYVASRAMEKTEAEGFVRQIRLRTPQSDPQFVKMVDMQTGRVVTTRIPVSAGMRAMGDQSLPAVERSLSSSVFWLAVPLFAELERRGYKRGQKHAEVFVAPELERLIPPEQRYLNEGRLK